MSEEAQEPFTPLYESAVSLHELKLRFEQAGFSNDEAMQLVCAMLVQALCGGKP